MAWGWDRDAGWNQIFRAIRLDIHSDIYSEFAVGAFTHYQKKCALPDGFIGVFWFVL
jgi:hypothetical protein